MDHSIIIPTRNRTSFLKALLDFYYKFNYSGTIIIGDDSDVSAYQENIKISESFKKVLKIIHFQGPASKHKNRSYRVVKSINQSIKLLETKYVSIRAEDDFLFPTTINKGIKFLEQNSDFACYLSPEYKVYFNKKNKIFKYKFKPWFGCNHQDPLERCSDYSLKPNLPICGVNKTIALKNIFQLPNFTSREPFIRDNDFTFDYFDQELLWCFVVYAHGKIFYNPKDLCGIRAEYTDPDHSWTGSTRRFGNPEFLHSSINILSREDSSIGLKQLYDDLFYIVKINNSKYSEKIISNDIWTIISNWHSRFPGSFENNVKKKIIKNSLIAKIKKLYSSLYFRDKYNLKKSENLTKFVEFWDYYIENST